METVPWTALLSYIIIIIIINMAKVLVLEPVTLTLQVHNILNKLR